MHAFARGEGLQVELPLMADHCRKIVRDALKSFFTRMSILTEF
ncbi:MAG: hypothetical protein PHC61_08530 [Chitinivibrionales bacterium]|nr:hypothetical protein [Chitinivibrionales bacterium]